MNRSAAEFVARLAQHQHVEQKHIAALVGQVAALNPTQYQLDQAIPELLGLEKWPTITDVKRVVSQIRPRSKKEDQLWERVEDYFMRIGRPFLAMSARPDSEVCWGCSDKYTARGVDPEHHYLRHRHYTLDELVNGDPALELAIALAQTATDQVPRMPLPMGETYHPLRELVTQDPPAEIAEFERKQTSERIANIKKILGGC